MTIEQQAIISDICFNYPASFDEIATMLQILGFNITREEVEQEYNSRL